MRCFVLLFCFFSSEGVGSLGLLHLLCVLPRTALLPQRHPRQVALLGPIHIETLAPCRIFPVGLRSSIGLRGKWPWYFVGVARALRFPPPPFFFLATLLT